MLEGRDIQVKFGGFLAVKSASVEVRPGEIVGIIGPNGAGKSTVLSAFAGLVSIMQGKFMIDGCPLKPAPDTLAGLGVLRTFQVPREFTHLSLLENLCVAAHEHPGDSLLGGLFMCKRARKYELGLRNKAREILGLFNLSHLADHSAGSLSGGQKKLLELARALMLSPRYLLLDEPFAGVSGPMVETISAQLLKLVASGAGLLLIEHNMEQMMKLCGKIYAMAEGEVIAVGSPAAILENERVIDAYIGRQS